MDELTFRVKARSESPTKTVVKARTFKMIIDEPADLGGTNDGPNPVEYILAALSGCLNVMCHIVAREMNIKLRGVEIKISGALNPEKLFGKETENRAGYKSIHEKSSPTPMPIKLHCGNGYKRLKRVVRLATTWLIPHRYT